MTISQMERILLVAKLGNVTEAARRLYISQPSLSQTITIVESELGTPIFDRKSQPLKLTPAGEIYIATAQRILHMNRNMIETIKNIQQGIAGTIGLGISIRRTYLIITKVISEFQQTFPYVSLKLSDGKPADYERWLLRGDIDLAVTNIPPINTSIGCYNLKPELYYLVVNKHSEFARRLDHICERAGKRDTPVSIKEVSDAPFIVLGDSHNSRTTLNCILQEAGISPRFIIETQTTEVSLQLVAKNAGITLAPMIYPNGRNTMYENDDLAFYHIDSCYESRHMYLLHGSVDSLTPAHYQLMYLILQYFSEEGTLSAQIARLKREQQDG